LSRLLSEGAKAQGELPMMFEMDWKGGVKRIKI